MRVPAALLLTMLISGCGTGAGDVRAPAPSETRYTASGTVLEDQQHGPRFCSGILQSLPPQCQGGLDLLGWDWSKVEHENVRGVRWGDYTVVTRWDGRRMTLAEPPSPPRERNSDQEPSSTTPCPKPEGGWKPIDPAKTTEKTLNAAMETARTSRHFAGTWVDQLIHPIREGNDPRQLVLNIAFTGELAANEREIRGVWGGALCVSSARHTEAELELLHTKVAKDVPDLRSSGVDTVKNQVSIDVWVASDELQQTLDARYGPSKIRVWGIFQPLR
ncbi:hypothetical protein GCM10027589_56030 [Actinocorallia lasiicapitis]